ncbi:putative nicotinamide N-methyase [Sphingobium sp. B11D3D]|nr:putative nicotinamide N-methyase [Sphingobium sp. B11D3D]
MRSHPAVDLGLPPIGCLDSRVRGNDKKYSSPSHLPGKPTPPQDHTRALTQNRRPSFHLKGETSRLSLPPPFWHEAWQ